MTAAHAPGRQSADQVLEKRSKGYLVVRSDDEMGWKWRRMLKLALRDAEIARNFWGVEVSVFDCETKDRVYLFRSLGS